MRLLDHQNNDEFMQQIQLVNSIRQMQHEQRSTPWKSFQNNRLQSFDDCLKNEGFWHRGASSEWRHCRGWLDWAILDWKRKNGVFDCIQLLTVWSYQIGDGIELMRRFCQAMDRTENGIMVCGVCRIFNRDKLWRPVEDEIRPGGIDSVERLVQFYSHFGFVDSGELSTEGRPLIVRTSPNYQPNPHEPEQI